MRPISFFGLLLGSAQLAVAFVGKSTQQTGPLYIDSLSSTYVTTNNDVSVYVPAANNKVVLFATLTANFNTLQYLACTIFRNGVNLFPDALQSIDASFTSENTPLTMTYLDSPPTSSAEYIYSLRCRGQAFVSANGNPRQLSAVLLTTSPFTSSIRAATPATINTATFVPYGLDVTATVASGESVLVLITSNFYPSTPGDGFNFGRFTVLRNSINIADGGFHPLMYTSGLLQNKRRAQTLIYVDSPGVGTNIPYSAAASKGGTNTALFYTGTSAETGTIAVVAVPTSRTAIFTATGTTSVSTNAWTSTATSVTVTPALITDKVLITVMLYIRCETAACSGALTIMRGSTNLGDATNGILMTSWSGQSNAGIKDASFGFLDSPGAAGVSATYSLFFRTFSGTISVSEAVVTRQMTAIVLGGAMPGPPTTQPTVLPTIWPSKVPTAQPTPQPAFFRSPSYNVSSGFSFAAVDAVGGSVMLWGEQAGASKLLTPVPGSAVTVVAARAAFLALKSDGCISAFGVAGHYEGASVYAAAESQLVVGSIVANEAAFAGVTRSGKVLAFGSYYNGGDVSTNAKCNGYATQLSSGVVSIVASSAAFAALKSDGTVYAWGNKYAGGGVSSETRTDIVNVRTVYATASAFAALLTSGAVKTWGDKFGGGDSSAVTSSLASGVLHIIGSQSVFVAYKQDTSIVVWGNPYYGGAVTSTVVPALTSGVKFVAFTAVAMAALKTDGSVVAWGEVNKGGDTSGVSSSLINIAALYSNRFAFAALTAAGGVVVWGDFENGGLIPSALASALSSGVTAIYSTHRAFAALKGATGQLVLWGSAFHGAGAGAATPYLTSGVRTVCANDAAFTAILQDGRAVAWGHPSSVPSPGLVDVSAKFAGVASCV